MSTLCRKIKYLAIIFWQASLGTCKSSRMLASRLRSYRQTSPPASLMARSSPLTRSTRPLRRGVAVPFRKRDAEGIRNISELRASDKEGMIFQLEPGIYEKVHQIDFTSLYPSIIVKYNLSPETIEHPERTGFLASVLSSLLNLRIETKRLKKTNPDYKGIDSVLKWMLVTCFGYTGYQKRQVRSDPGP